MNVTPYPGTNRELFAGEFANEQKIKGRKPARWLLVPDRKGGYRLATNKEVDRILEKYGLPPIKEAIRKTNEDLGEKG